LPDLFRATSSYQFEDNRHLIDLPDLMRKIVVQDDRAEHQGEFPDWAQAIASARPSGCPVSRLACSSGSYPETVEFGDRSLRDKPTRRRPEWPYADQLEKNEDRPSCLKAHR
jgi:hypothetical protein